MEKQYKQSTHPHLCPGPASCQYYPIELATKAATTTRSVSLSWGHAVHYTSSASPPSVTDKKNNNHNSRATEETKEIMLQEGIIHSFHWIWWKLLDG